MPGMPLIDFALFTATTLCGVGVVWLAMWL